MQRQINETGISVTAIGLGAMPLSIQNRPETLQAEAVIETFIESGGNFIDTANVYCLDDSDIGHNERLIQKVLKRLGKQDVMVATKGGLRRPNGNWTVDGHPDFLKASCEASLEALGTDCISLYQLHAVDPKIGLSPSLEALLQLKTEGKIAHIGLSNVSLAQLQEAQTMAPIVSVQNRCNPFEQSDFTTGLSDYCKAHNITLIPHSPVGGHRGHERLRLDSKIGNIAEKHGVSRYAIALAWLLARGEHVLPIPGASKISSIVDSLKAMTITLDQSDINSLNQLA